MPTIGDTYIKVIHHPDDIDEIVENMERNYMNVDGPVEIDEYKYTPGLHTDKYEFLFTKFDNFIKYLYLGDTIAYITIPHNVKIRSYTDNTDMYAKKIIITQLIPIKDLSCWNDPDFCLNAVRQCGSALEYVPDSLKTNKLCKIAIRNGGYSLRYIPHELQTKELCLLAIKTNTGVLDYVREDLKTNELCLAAVKVSGWALNHVPDLLKTNQICLIAVKRHGFALEWVPAELKTKEICMTAIKKYGFASKWVPEELQSYELCLEAVRQNACALQFVKEDFKEACLAAVELIKA
jgi:hypothetical protein